MKIESLRVENFGPFALLEEMKFGNLATIVGRNDVGKSYILRALQVFLGGKLTESHIHDGANSDDEVIIEVTFSNFPEEIEIEQNIATSFEQEMLLDSQNFLRIIKVYSRDSLSKFRVFLKTNDFNSDLYRGLAFLKEKDLNQRCEEAGIEVSRAGRGITKKGKRDLLREKAQNEGIGISLQELEVNEKDDIWKLICSLFPTFELFVTDTKLGVGETTFQSKFRPIVKSATDDPSVSSIKDDFTRSIRTSLQNEIEKIFQKLKRHTDAFQGLTVRPNFSWEKAVTFDIIGKDRHNVEVSLEQRGSGMRRLLMVAFFEYLADRKIKENERIIFAIEEPENCLHPSLQRKLAKSFSKLISEGNQIIITSHSPVFASLSPIEDLTLVIREGGRAKSSQHPELDLVEVAEELGVEPSDQIIGYSACIFVEGIDDILFWNTVASKFKDSGYIKNTFEDKNIGFIICGGDNLKHWINRNAMIRLNRHFGVTIDSDLKSPTDNIPQRKLNWKKQCEDTGGVFFILKKREVENYLHPDAIVRSGRPLVIYNDFTDIKAVFGDNVIRVIEDMTCEEILEGDKYVVNGTVHHELKEIVETFLKLSD